MKPQMNVLDSVAGLEEVTAGVRGMTNRSRILDRPPLAFLHVFKTGGTTVSDWLDSRYAADDSLICEDPWHFRRIGETETESGDVYLSKEVIRGHFFLPDGLEYARLHHKYPRLFFTVIRSPEAQLMSSLWHGVSHTNNLVAGRDHPALDFSKYRRAMVAEAASFRRNNTGMQLSFFLNVPPRRRFWVLERKKDIAATAEYLARRALETIHIVGLSDRLADTLRILSWHMEWPAPRQFSDARVSGAGRQQMDEEIKALLWRHLMFDQALYAEANRRFMRDYEMLCSAAGSAENIDDFLDVRAEKHTQSALIAKQGPVS